MIGTKPLEEIITLCIHSAYIEDEKGVSVILCARVESGKTSLLAKFSLNSGVVYLTSGTAFGIRKDYLGEFYHGRKRVLIIPDLIVPLNQSKDTVALFIGLFMISSSYCMSAEAYHISGIGLTQLLFLLILALDSLIRARAPSARLYSGWTISLCFSWVCLLPCPAPFSMLCLRFRA